MNATDQPRTRRRVVPGVCVPLIALPLLLGCTEARPEEPLTPFRHTQRTPTPVEQRLLAPRAKHRLLIRVLAFEEDRARLKLSLELLNAAPPEGLDVSPWIANHMLLVAIEREKLPMLLANLPKPVSGFEVALGHASIDHPVTITSNTVRLRNIPYLLGDGKRLARDFPIGDFRILFRMEEPGDDSLRTDTSIGILPQHYTHSSLRLSDPHDRSTEGFSIEPLRVNHPLSTNDCWIITLDPRTISDSTSWGLADAMLRGESEGNRIQAIVFITLEEPADEP